MGNLLKEKAADFYRTKGVLAFAGQGDTKFVFQGMQFTPHKVDHNESLLASNYHCGSPPPLSTPHSPPIIHLHSPSFHPPSPLTLFSSSFLHK